MLVKTLTIHVGTNEHKCRYKSDCNELLKIRVMHGG